MEMKRFFLNVLTLILLSFCCFAFAQNAANKNTPKVELLDQTVAIVNNDVITKTQLDAQVRSIKARMQSAHVAAPPSKTLEKQVLEQMINTKVQLQFAERTGLRTS
ncbi:MAG: molecular chaperone SurA, partial [Cyanobacteria bacterium]|nr:molecular chaperone SurA [Cyanobacteria bacterium CG_2015-04_32_10]